ncbi:MAG TPA: nucleotidyltransferase family protein [Anaerolineae bacterium]|nr:nucleotidyltransferase family protein [Anaerolineae bacterium]
MKKHKPFMSKQFRVKKIGIFGSYVRGEESEKSDVDILIEFHDTIGWEFFDVKEYLEKLLGKKVDLFTVKALKRQLRKEILQEVVYV